MKIKAEIKIWWLLLTVGILILLFGWGRYLWQRSHRNEAEKLTEKISKIMLLPSERPQLATVVDKNKLGDQTLFKRAENGDKLLIFTQSGIAILYRPTTNQVVEKTNITGVSDGTVMVTPLTLKEEIKIKVAVYNGSGKTGVATKLVNEILARVENIEVVNKTDAREEYDKSKVVDLSGNWTEVAQSLAKSIDGEMSNLPAGEKKPAADLLIIVGKNWQ